MPKTRQMNVRLSPQARDALDYLVDETGWTQTKVIERALIVAEKRRKRRKEQNAPG